ncbi:hypothetical protein D3C87_299540 [compost metagenome]
MVFDLDSTLFDVSPRLERILLDFAALPENQKLFPEQVLLFKGIKTLRSDWGIVGALQRAGLDGHHPEFQEAVRAFWHKSFFSNHYLQYDVPYEGAVEYVQSLHQAGARIAYLTGRDVERMGTGSVEILNKWGFPLDSKSELVLKPHRSMDDAEFKSDWFIQASQESFEKIYFFENEPVNLHRLLVTCPEVEMIFFKSTHAGKAEPPENIPAIMNFLLQHHE